jgi:sec-independent protein translocase protein TatB
MFDIGWSELVLIGLVALIVIGPKELPTVLRTVGQYMGKIKRMASEFQGQFQEALREAEVADLKEQASDLTGSLKGITDYDPLADIDKDKENKDDASDWDELEAPERDEPATGSAAETEPPAGEKEPTPAAPVTAVDSAPAEEIQNVEPTPAETPPPKQARGSA